MVEVDGKQIPYSEAKHAYESSRDVGKYSSLINATGEYPHGTFAEKLERGEQRRREKLRYKTPQEEEEGQ